MAYTKQTWANGPDGLTPISADRLNYMENGIEAATLPNTSVGRSVLNASDAAAARLAIGAAKTGALTLATSTSNLSVSTTTATDIPGLSITFTSESLSDVFTVTLGVDAQASGGTSALVGKLNVDSGTVPAGSLVFTSAGLCRINPISKRWYLTNLAPGTHTVKATAAVDTVNSSFIVSQINSTLSVFTGSVP